MIKSAFSVFLVLACLSSVRADASFVHYQFELSEDFLFGEDSTAMILHHGERMVRFYARKGEPIRVRTYHYIPCPSGPYPPGCTTREDEIEYHNGTVYHVYNEEANRVLTVESVIAPFHRTPVRDSIYRISLDSVVGPLDELENFLRRKTKFDNLERSLAGGSLPRSVQFPAFRKAYKELFHSYNTPDLPLWLFNQRLGLNVPDNTEQFAVTFPGDGLILIGHVGTRHGRIRRN